MMITHEAYGRCFASQSPVSSSASFASLCIRRNNSQFFS
jgi:hypothetical protein